MKKVITVVIAFSMMLIAYGAGSRGISVYCANRWECFPAVSSGNCQSVNFWVINADRGATGLYCEDIDKSLYFPVNYRPGTLITRLCIKFKGISADPQSQNGIRMRFIKRDEMQTIEWTTVGVEQTYTNGTLLTTVIYDMPDVVIENGYSYAVEVTSLIDDQGIEVYMIGIETLIRNY